MIKLGGLRKRTWIAEEPKLWLYSKYTRNLDRNVIAQRLGKKKRGLKSREMRLDEGMWHQDCGYQPIKSDGLKVEMSQMLCSPIGPSSFWSKSQIGPVERFYQFWGRSWALKLWVSPTVSVPYLWGKTRSCMILQRSSRWETIENFTTVPVGISFGLFWECYIQPFKHPGAPGSLMDKRALPSA